MGKVKNRKEEDRKWIKYTNELYYNSEEPIKEEFKEVYIEDYGYVTINNLGTKVYTKTGKFPIIYQQGGYLGIKVGTTQGSRNVMKFHNLRLHRLVVMAFIPNPNNLPEVNHKDGNKHNNCVTNLEWCTNLQNMRHAWSTGLIYGLNGSKNGRAKLNEDQVKEIKEKYSGKRGEIAHLAREYNVSWSLIKFIVTDKNWKHVNSSNS